MTPVEAAALWVDREPHELTSRRLYCQQPYIDAYADMGAGDIVALADSYDRRELEALLVWLASPGEVEAAYVMLCREAFERGERRRMQAPAPEEC